MGAVGLVEGSCGTRALAAAFRSLNQKPFRPDLFSKPMNMWTFIRVALTPMPRKKAERLADEEIAKVRERLASHPATREQLASYGQVHLTKVPEAFLLVAVFFAGLAGNLLASVIAHFVGAENKSLIAQGNLGWTIAGTMGLLGAAWFLFWARGMYHYHLRMGFAYARAVGGEML